MGRKNFSLKQSPKGVPPCREECETPVPHENRNLSGISFRNFNVSSTCSHNTGSYESLVEYWTPARSTGLQLTERVAGTHDIPGHIIGGIENGMGDQVNLVISQDSCHIINGIKSGMDNDAPQH